MTRGMPGAWQVSIGSAIMFPASSLRTLSNIARYSGVSGASRLLAPSKRSGPMRCHRPPRSGYFASSKACVAVAMPRVAANAMIPSVLRKNMIFDSDDDPAVVPAQAGTHTPQHRDVAGPAITETMVVMGPRLRGDDSGRVHANT